MARVALVLASFVLCVCVLALVWPQFVKQIPTQTDHKIPKCNLEHCIYNPLILHTLQVPYDSSQGIMMETRNKFIWGRGDNAGGGSWGPASTMEICCSSQHEGGQEEHNVRTETDLSFLVQKLISYHV